MNGWITSNEIKYKCKKKTYQDIISDFKYTHTLKNGNDSWDVYLTPSFKQNDESPMKFVFVIDNLPFGVFSYGKDLPSMDYEFILYTKKSDESDFCTTDLAEVKEYPGVLFKKITMPREMMFDFKNISDAIFSLMYVLNNQDGIPIEFYVFKKLSELEKMYRELKSRLI